MKCYKSFLLLLLLSVGLTACSDDGYWTEYKPGINNEYGTEISLMQDEISVVVPADQTVFPVQLRRSNADARLEIPVDIYYYSETFDPEDIDSSRVFVIVDDEALTVDEQIIFEEGYADGYLKINLSDDMEIGSEYNVEINIPKTLVSASNLPLNDDDVKCIVCEVCIVKDYTWEAAGSCLWTSDLLEATGRVEIQKAKEANGLYRAMSPWAALDPEEVSGSYPFEFYLDEDFNASTIPHVWNDFGLTYSNSYGNLALLYHPAYGANFYNEGPEFHIEGAYGLTEGYIYDVGAHESFVWDDGYPGE